MALGTPVAGAAAYSAAAGTTVAPAYPAGISAGDALVMFVGMKPSTANGGTVTTPTGWTLQDSLTAAGGYGTTIGADTGNTNLWCFTKDTVTGSETGTLSVTLGTNNVAWAFMVRVPDSGGTLSYGSADGQRTTTPTSPMSIALTNGATATNFQAGDVALWAMCIPTDVTTPSQFSAQSITATGATFGTAVELNEPDSTTGNDIGGYSAYATVTAGSSTTAPTVTSTLAGTLTNVRGPVVLLRVRETVVPVTHSTSGTLTGQLGSVAGTAQHNIPHPTSGVLGGQEAVIVGAADHEAQAVPHTSTGALTGPGSTLDGSATRFRAFSTSGVLAGQTATIAGDADHEAQTVPHTTTGALTGPGSTIAGSATHQYLHTTSGVLSGSVATLAGSAARLHAFGSSGELTGQGAVVEGDADHEPQALPHVAEGALVGEGAEMGGDADHQANPNPPAPFVGDGDGWTVEERKKRDDRIEQEREDRTKLRQLIQQAVDPQEPVQVVKTEKAVVVLRKEAEDIVLPQLPTIDVDQIVSEVRTAFKQAGLKAEMARTERARKQAQEAMATWARENVRQRVMRKRQQDEFLLLMT